MRLKHPVPTSRNKRKIRLGKALCFTYGQEVLAPFLMSTCNSRLSSLKGDRIFSTGGKRNKEKGKENHSHFATLQKYLSVADISFTSRGQQSVFKSPPKTFLSEGKGSCRCRALVSPSGVRLAVDHGHRPSPSVHTQAPLARCLAASSEGEAGRHVWCGWRSGRLTRRFFSFHRCVHACERDESPSPDLNPQGRGMSINIGGTSKSSAEPRAYPQQVPVKNLWSNRGSSSRTGSLFTSKMCSTFF